MSTLKTALIIAFAIVLATFTWWVANHGHSDHVGHPVQADHAGLALDAGSKWATDDGLRRGMARIQALAASSAPSDAAQAAKMGKAVQDEVAVLVANCRLAPGADGVLHVLIGDILSGAADMARPETAAQGLDRIRSALRLYPHYFDHPGWRGEASAP